MKTGKLVAAYLWISAGLLSAQSVYFYTNTSTEDSMLYVSGNVQSSSWYGAQGAVHTYGQHLTISSPSNRSNSCGFNDTVPATQAVNLLCGVQLSIHDASGNLETGFYSVEGSQSATCSDVGQFGYEPISISAPLTHITAYYRNTGASSKNPGGNYSVAYARCHPIGTTCDYCNVTFGGPPFVSYGLFDGAEIHIGNSAGCVMVLQSQAADCSKADPLPGTGGGVAMSRPGTLPKDSRKALSAAVPKTCPLPRSSNGSR